MNLLKAIFGTKTERELKNGCAPLVARINEIEVGYQSLSDERAARPRPTEFRERLARGRDTRRPPMRGLRRGQERLPPPLRQPRAMVCGHESVWDMVPFDVQLMGGIVLHQGKIAEMQTGEGKTLVATLPLYLNALAGKGMSTSSPSTTTSPARQPVDGRRVYEFLGLTVGCIQNDMSPAQRRAAAYACDITYGTNNEFGFDYLRDNMAVSRPARPARAPLRHRRRGRLILIDEARTPLIISGPAAVSTHQYDELKPRIEHLVRSCQREICNRL
jgi:preprotein translocase subunit SecA